MGFLMALRVNTFQSCQNVVKNPPDCTTNGERFHCELLTCFCCVVFFCVFFLFLFFFPPNLHSWGRPAQMFTPCPHLLVRLRNLCRGRNLDCGWLLSLRIVALQLPLDRGALL